MINYRWTSKATCCQPESNGRASPEPIMLSYTPKGCSCFLRTRYSIISPSSIFYLPRAIKPKKLSAVSEVPSQYRDSRTEGGIEELSHAGNMARFENGRTISSKIWELPTGMRMLSPNTESLTLKPYNCKLR